MSNRDQLHERLRQLAESGRLAEFGELARELHASDLSDVLASLDDELRVRVVEALPPEITSEAIAEMEDEENPGELLAAMETELAADIVEELDADDAVDLIGDLSPEAATRILSEVEHDDRADIERLLRYDEETAGGLMTTEVVAVADSATATEAIEEIRRQAEEVGDFFQVFCVDGSRRLVGTLPLQRLVVAKPGEVVRNIMEPPPAVASPEMDQEVVARLMARYNVPSMPVVDGAGALLGRVTFDDVIDVVEAEQTEDLLRFGGGSAEELLGGTWYNAVRHRLPWLYLNLITAFLAGWVVYHFKDTVARLVILAALMPIVAGLGGNAGTQSLAVTVRRIALGMSPPGTRLAHVGKEMLIGLVNGIAVGAVVAVVATVIGEGWQLGLVVLLAMWGNQVVAVALGAAVPLVLDRMGLDPAVASSVFVTAFTDVVGFFLLLGLAAWLLLPGLV